MELEDAIRSIQSGDFKTGWAMFNGVRSKRAYSKAELINARNSIAEALIDVERKITEARRVKAEQEHVLHEIEIQYELMRAQAELEQIQIAAFGKLIKDAADEGMTVDTKQELVLFGGRTQVEIDRERAVSDIREREKANELMRELDKFERTKDIELRVSIEEMREQVRLAILADHLGGNQMIELLLEQSDRVLIQMQDIQNNPRYTEVTKRRMLNDREEVLLMLKEQRRGQEDRLLQAPDRKRVQEDAPDSDVRRNVREAFEEGEE